MRIMEQEGTVFESDDFDVVVPEYMKEIVAEITRLARRSPDVNQRSGVSVRASVANYEAMLANALRRSIRLGESEVVPRISDLPFVMPALQGKVELETVEDGKDEQIIERLIHGAVVAVFNRTTADQTLEPVIEAFKAGISVETGEALASTPYQQMLQQVEGLRPVVDAVTHGDTRQAVQASAIEFILEGLHLNKRLNKDTLPGQARYRG
jgi:magnesium chelatase subunit I